MVLAALLLVRVRDGELQSPQGYSGLALAANQDPEHSADKKVKILPCGAELPTRRAWNLLSMLLSMAPLSNYRNHLVGR